MRQHYGATSHCQSAGPASTLVGDDQESSSASSGRQTRQSNLNSHAPATIRMQRHSVATFSPHCRTVRKRGRGKLSRVANAIAFNGRA